MPEDTAYLNVASAYTVSIVLPINSKSVSSFAARLSAGRFIKYAINLEFWVFDFR